ncbi:hypothetical protein KP79_PYT02226 [Mizuhopecten yessoensis]|uniref:Uncharacterized protein n=1 Tax=Mizuhopecten yessoensis TaxID=6573 RepID=A0A210PX43_MIZYE|nr:hypothetical protein KP79_PYT02226 [Mizuhopecten yessoensis]
MKSPTGNLSDEQDGLEAESKISSRKRGTSGKLPDIQPRVVMTQPPRLPVFSGDGKGDVIYNLWRYEVESIQREDFTGDQIAAAIRRSLTGEQVGLLCDSGQEPQYMNA